MSIAANPSTTPTSNRPPKNRQQMFGIEIDAYRMENAIDQIYQWIAGELKTCQYVVTPNVDHIVQLQENLALQESYKLAGMVLADGWPLVAASRLFGKNLPERVAGSDLVPRIFEAATERHPIRVFLLGAAPGVAIRAAENIQRKWANVTVVGTYSPPLGFEKCDHENQYIIERIAVVRPDVLVVGFGAPKQELWVTQHKDQIQAKVALCVGATIDFLAGQKRRAPRIMQRLGIEWLHRMLSEPRRLFKRYAYDARVFPGLVWKQFKSQADKPTV